GDDSGGQVVGLLDRVDVRGPGVREAVTGAARELAARTDVKHVDQPYDAPERAGGFVSGDRTALLIMVTLHQQERAQRDTSVDQISERLRQVAAAARAA